MYLKKIEIQGFKSFAKKTVLEFDQGIISVVGPNGSGKSNLADAIRWVMGEQSMKAVRSKKSEDVIFAGSDKKGKQGMAEVAITFDNFDRKMPLDFSEVVIARRIFRSGESEYLINKRPVRLMDISEVLAKSGYGGYSYHIISQGNIDQLILAGPSGIKGLIEEASGVKPYYIKRDRAMRKLDRSKENLMRVAGLVAEIEPRLRSLRRQTKRMEHREQIVADLKQLQIKFFSSRYTEIKKDLSGYEGKVAYFDKEIDKFSQEIESGSKTLQQKEYHAEKKSTGYKILQEELRRLENEKNKVQEDLATVRGQLKVKAPGQSHDANFLQSQKVDLVAKIKELESQITALENQSVLSEKNFSQHKKIFDSLSGDLDKLQKQLERGSEPVDLQSLKNEVEKIYSRYQSLMYQINNLRSEEDFESLRQESSNLEIILIKIKNRFAKLADIGFNQNASASLGKEIQKVFAQREKVQRELSKIEADKNSVNVQKVFFQNQLTELQKKLADTESEIKKNSGGNAKDPQAELVKNEEKLSSDLQEFVVKITKLETDLKEFIDSETKLKQELLREERDLRLKQDNLSKIKDQKGMVLIEKARLDANLESVVAEFRKSLPGMAVDTIKQPQQQAVEPGLEQKIQKIKLQLESIGSVDDLTMQEYRETEQRYNHLTSQSKDLESAINDLRKVIAELDVVIKKQFQNGFEVINEKFAEFFRILFSGGRARMGMIKEQKVLKPQNSNGNGENEENGDEEEDESLPAKEVLTGIDIRVTPPGKKLASISALSGGERALTAIALLMSILSAFPSPFIVLDEVDAALDEANSIRLGKILARLAHQTQFITITHNRETMRQSRALYGVTMGDDGISKVLSIKLEKAVEIAE